MAAGDVERGGGNRRRRQQKHHLILPQTGEQAENPAGRVLGEAAVASCVVGIDKSFRGRRRADRLEGMARAAPRYQGLVGA